MARCEAGRRVIAFGLSLTALGLGTALALAAARYPSQRPLLEGLAGLLLLGGLCLIGLGLPLFR